MGKFFLDLEAKYGSEAVSHLASAYEAVLMSHSCGPLKRFPDRSVRAAIVEAMLVEGEASGFQVDGMREAGAAVAAVTLL